MRVMKERWVRECRLKYGQSNEVTEMTILRGCENSGIDVYNSFEKVTGEGVTSEI